MKLLIFTILCLSVIQVYSQEKKERPTFPCAGLDVLPIRVSVVLNATVQKEFIKKNDLLAYDLRLGISDTTFKIIGFVAVYDCHSRALFDINTRAYLGNTTKVGDPFIDGIWIGDHLGIDCINVERNGKRYLVRGLLFEVY